MAARSSSETASELNLALEYGIAQKRDVFDTIGTIICTRRMITSLQETIRQDLERISRKPRKRRQYKEPEVCLRCVFEKRRSRAPFL